MRTTNTPIVPTRRLRCLVCGVRFAVPTSRSEDKQQFAERAEDIHRQLKPPTCSGTNYDFRLVRGRRDEDVAPKQETEIDG